MGSSLSGDACFVCRKNPTQPLCRRYLLEHKSRQALKFLCSLPKMRVWQIATRPEVR